MKRREAILLKAGVALWLAIVRAGGLAKKLLLAVNALVVVAVPTTTKITKSELVDIFIMVGG